MNTRFRGRPATTVRTAARALAMTAWPEEGPPVPVTWKIGTFGYVHDTRGPLLSPGMDPAILQLAMQIRDVGDEFWWLRIAHTTAYSPYADRTNLGGDYGDTRFGVFAHCNDGTWFQHFYDEWSSTAVGAGFLGNISIPKDPTHDMYADHGGRVGNEIVFTEAPQAVRSFLLFDGSYVPVGTYDPDTGTFTVDGWDALHWVQPDMDGITAPIHLPFTSWGTSLGAPSGATYYYDDTYRPIVH